MFNPQFALKVGIPLAEAAYNAMDGAPSVLPNGVDLAAYIAADKPDGNSTVSAHAMAQDSNIFGIVATMKSAAGAGNHVYVAFRGTVTAEDWLQDFSIIPTRNSPYGMVSDGFLDTYHLVQENLMHTLEGYAGPDDFITVIGHSLGGALAVLAALDIAIKLRIEPAVMTFGSPHVGLHNFNSTFNQTIENCFRVTNFLDIVPLVPPIPYGPYGTDVGIDSGGEISFVGRHMLPAYRTGLTKMAAIASPPAPGHVTVPRGEPRPVRIQGLQPVQPTGTPGL